MKHLDSYLRYNSATLLLVCNPENEKDALEIIIRSASKRFSDNQEFLRLCMKLNFNNSTLDFIYDLLNDLTDISRVFAIKLLYHNNEYKLTKELLDELIQGLIGDASFLDWSGNLSDDGVERVIGKEKFYNSIRACLNSDKLEIKESASSSLLSYYSNKLSNKDKATCWLLYIQYREYALIDFHSKFQVLLDNKDFVQELKKKATEIEEMHNLREPLFLKYYEAIKENGDWKDFFLALIKSGRHLDHHRLEFLYGFIIKLGHSVSKEVLGKAIKKVMSYPTFSQDHQYNFLLPQLAVFAHEFGELNDQEITGILNEYVINETEIACALLYRLGKVPVGYSSDRSNIEYISLFATNKVSPFTSIDIEQLDMILEDGEDIPDNLLQVMESVILTGGLDNDQLIKLTSKGNLATYFAIVVGFCRNPAMELQDFMSAEEIGSSKYFARGKTQYHKSILLKIKEVLVSDNNWKKLYIEALVNSITDQTKSKDTIDLFDELFTLKAEFDFKLLPLLYESLLLVPYRYNLNLVYYVNNYIISLNEEEKQELIDPLRTILRAVNNSSIERNESEYELMSWSLSLILMYIENKVDEDIKRGFLTGLRNVFIQGGRNYPTDNHSKVQFKGRDIFIHSNEIIKRINPSHFKYLIESGANSNVPEISTLCSILKAFSAS